MGAKERNPLQGKQKSSPESQSECDERQGLNPPNQSL